MKEKRILEFINSLPEEAILKECNGTVLLDQQGGILKNGGNCQNSRCNGSSNGGACKNTDSCDDSSNKKDCVNPIVKPAVNYNLECTIINP